MLLFLSVPGAQTVTLPVLVFLGSLGEALLPATAAALLAAFSVSVCLLMACPHFLEYMALSS